METDKKPYKATCYLAGAIEAAPDHGEGWRRYAKPLLKDNNFDVIDPFEREGDLWEKHGLDITDWDSLKAPENAAKRKALLNEIVDKDLGEVLRSDILLVYYDEYVSKGAGTLGEITVAHLHGVYVLILLAPEFDEDDLPGWVVGCTDKVIKMGDDLLGALDEATAYLEETEPDWAELGLESFRKLLAKEDVAMSDEDWADFEAALAEDYNDGEEG